VSVASFGREVRMGEHPNAARMREAVAKFVAGDLEGFMATFSDDIVWRSGGSSALSGTYEGKDDVARWFATIRRFAGDTIDVEPVDVLADDEHLTIFLHITAKRDDQVLDVEVANAFRVDPDGRWKESWYLPNDQAAWDRFFS
jgi:ketosteroid isomerase-like protein